MNRLETLAWAVLLCAWMAGAAPVASDDWHETLSPHFQAFHETPFAPQGLVLTLERMHNRLRLDLSAFAPWMAKERVKIYLYHDRNGYLSGRFKPPAWSNGISDYEKRLVVSYEQGEPKKLFEVLGHEMTHLFFESYWGEESRQPPAWLNEGLAMLEEADDSQNQEGSSWYRAMGYLLERGTIPLEQLMRVSPTEQIVDQQTAVLWYVEAYSLVYFLARKHTRLQFFNLCRELRDGRELEYALSGIYHYPNRETLERAWRRWLNSPEMRRSIANAQRNSSGALARRGSAVAAPRRDSSFESADFQNLSFHGLRQ